MSRSFRIAATTVGPRRWWLVRIHPDLATMRAAASAYDPSTDLTQCYACCQLSVDEDGLLLDSPSGFAGVLRFADGYLQSEIVTHELVHAAVAVYRLNVSRTAKLGRGPGPHEEALAYLYGDLYTSFESRFTHKLSQGCCGATRRANQVASRARVTR